MAVTTKAKGGREDLNLYDGKSKTFSRLDSTGGSQTITKINDFVDVLQVYGSGSNYTIGTLDAAIKAVGSSNVELYLSAGNWVIDSNFSFPSTATLVLEHGCYFTISSSITLTLNGPLKRTRYNTFRGDGDYTLSELTKNSLPVVQHSTTVTAKADTTLIIGEVAHIRYYSGTNLINADYDVVATSTGTHDGFEYHSDDGSAGGSVFQLKLRIPAVVNAAIAGIYFDNSTDNATQLLRLLQKGVREVYSPDGTALVNSAVSATLADHFKIHGPGIIKWGGSSTTNWMIKIDCNDFDLDFGVSLEGNNLISAGLYATNNTAMTGDLPSLRFRDGKHKEFKMNSASIFNEAAFIEGSYEVVEIDHNNIKDITRASGTGTPGSAGTTGITVHHLSSTYYPRKIIIHDNITDTITSEDSAGANDVDQDGLRVIMPPPSNFDNTDTTVKPYTRIQVESYNNTYINCRGRAEKYQCVPHSHHNTIIRNGDRTMNAGSVEINCQWGVGTVHDIDFYYEDYAGPTSPFSTSISLVSFFHGTDYGERKVGAKVDGLRVYNHISDSLDNTIDAIVTWQTDAGPADTDFPVLSLKQVEMSGGDVDNIARVSFTAGGQGLVVLRDIAVPDCNFGCIGTGTANTDLIVDAVNVMNYDGITTPANATNFVTDFTGGNQTFSGKIQGYGNRGWLDNYNVGADFTQAPKLLGAALADPDGSTGGVASFQTAYLEDDATATLDRRGFTAGNHIIVVHCNNASETTSGIFYCGGASAAIYEMTNSAGTNFALGTGSNPDTDVKLNLWVDANGKLNVKNRLGATYSINVLFIG